MAAVFWDSQGIIMIDYLKKSKTIAGAYYATLLDRLKDKLNENQPILSRRKVIFNQDTVPHIDSRKDKIA